LTLIGIVVVAVLSTVFSMNVGLVSFAVSVVLLLIGAANEGEALKKIPWNTLIMITGVGMLISVVTELGGIVLLSDIISKLMGAKTASAIITVLAGMMSWVSSASGVVMPTLIPTVPGLVASVSGASAVDLVVGICIGANAAAFSPLSSCGALMLAAYSTSNVATTEGRNKMFTRLFVFSSACILVSALIALTGFFGLFS
jgi:di/tricarboxylate transporter